MHATDVEPIRADWKINRVITEYPELLDVLVAASPAFSNLRNPVLRRVKSRLVTVQQAARIAGIDPNGLVEQLNEAAGIQPHASEPDVPTDETTVDAPPDWLETAEEGVRLDVRPFQRRGEEPFSAIMAAARDVPVGKVLVLENTFEPVPLYDVLGQRGFDHWAEQHGEDEWRIYFYNAGNARKGSPSPPPKKTSNGPADAMPDWDAPTATITIDVSELVPPEPMIRILEALESLEPGSSLLVHHVRRPMHLYPRLDELGYRHETRELESGRVQVLIEKPSEPSGAAS